MVLAAPEFVIAERIELLDEVEVAAELQHRVLADRMMRGEKGSKFQARHLFLSGPLLLFLGLSHRLRAQLLQGNCGRAWRPMQHGAMHTADGSRWSVPRANLHLGALRLRECRFFPFKAATYLKQSEATASLQLSSQRKRDLLDHFEKNGNELDHWRELNAAYRADGRKFSF